MTDMFKTHLLNEVGKDKARLIGETFVHLLNEVTSIAGPNADPRAMAIMRTKLEEACFYGKKAVALQEEMQEGSPRTR
jgi:hypothetical protein